MEDRIRKIMIWLLTLIAFFLPFEHWGSFRLFNLTVRISQLLALALMVIWLFALVTKKISYKKNYLTWPLMIFLAINLWSLTKAEDLNRSLLVFFFVLFTTFFGWLLTQLVENQKDLTKIILGLLTGLVFVSLFGFWQFFGDNFGLSPAWTGLRPNYVKEKIGFTRVEATAAEPLYFADYLFIPIFLLLTLWVKKPLTKFNQTEKKFFNPKVMMLLIFLGLSNFILTVARGAYLAFLAALILFISLLRQEFKDAKKLLGFILLLLITVVFSWQLIRTFDQSSYRLNQLKYEGHLFNLLGGSSYGERQQTMALAWQAFKENPILGLGIGGFGPRARSQLPWWQQNEWKIVNNEYLEILAETGLVGFAAFLFLLGVIIYNSIRALGRIKDQYQKSILIGLLVSLVAILLQYFTFSTLYIMHIWFLIGLLVVAGQSNIKELPQIELTKIN